ncbi:MAG: HIT domain-containing protein [Hyphomicrobiales bacterium]|nr:HIT domain-containing protein [Hyphomicrobiales bacterium]
MEKEFKTAARLEAESMAIAKLPLSDLRLNTDARFPWLILVPRRPAVEEIIDLNAADRAVLFDEIVRASNSLKAISGCEKLNVAALGNMVRQLHVHVIARFTDDPAWPGPVWGVGEAVAYDPPVRDKLIARIREDLVS